MKAILVLEDETCFEGISVGVEGERSGEVILNTSVVGYQEIMTDPANAGKIMVFAYPLIGNYGVNKKFYESKKCWVEAVITKEVSRIYSNWQAEDSFENFLESEDVFALSDVDTRTLAVKIRDCGEMFGIVSTKTTKIRDLLKKLKDYKKDLKKDFIAKISTKKIFEIKPGQKGSKIAVLDIGILNSFIREISLLGCNITLLPYDTPADKIQELNFDGLIISGGPEEDISIPQIVAQIKKLIGKIPILGISTGCEIISLAVGGKLKKMKAGHRGVNYPVKSPDSFKGEITVQNHAFILDEASIKGNADIKVTLKNLNDNSIEEMESEPLRFISAQYYPASPGLDEVNELFRRFLNMTNKKARNLTCQSAKI